jgi:hypothetical protein
MWASADRRTGRRARVFREKGVRAQNIRLQERSSTAELDGRHVQLGPLHSAGVGLWGPSGPRALFAGRDRVEDHCAGMSVDAWTRTGRGGPATSPASTASAEVAMAS